MVIEGDQVDYDSINGIVDMFYFSCKGLHFMVSYVDYQVIQTLVNNIYYGYYSDFSHYNN